MLGSSTVELVLGLAFIFLLLSLIVSAVREAIEARLKTRSRHLARGIVQLLGSPEAARQLYEHPLVRALHGSASAALPSGFRGLTFAGSLWEVLKSPFVERSTLPSYIPAAVFAKALLGLKLEGAPAEALQTLLATAESGAEQRVKAVADWYDSAMDRVAGWYKRETQHLLFWLGLVVAVALNVDAVFLAQFLHASDTARAELVRGVEAAVEREKLGDKVDALRRVQQPAAAAAPDAAASATPEQLRRQVDAADVAVSAAVRRLTDLQLPIGWTRTRWNEFRQWDSPQPWQTAAGWLLTAFAISFGAPFWFDLLNKIMVIRSTVKPHEKSPEEASEDRQASAPAPAR